MLSPGVLFRMLVAFGLFAMGLAARSLAPRPFSVKTGWLNWLSSVFRYGLMIVLLLAAMKALPASTQLPPEIPSNVGGVLDAVDQAQSWAWGLLPYPVVVALAYGLQPDQLRWILAVVFVSILVVELVVRRDIAEAAPFDAVLGRSAHSLMQFTWLTVALMAVCLVALPTLIVAGQAGLHIRLNVADWFAHGAPPLGPHRRDRSSC